MGFENEKKGDIQMSEYSGLHQRTDFTPTHRSESVREDASSAQDNNVNFIEIIQDKFLTRVFSFFSDLLDRLMPPLKIRLLYCAIGAVILSLSVFGFGNDNMNSLSAVELYSMAGIIAITLVFGCILDETLFHIIDSTWTSSEEIKLYAHCLNGPLGAVMAIVGTRYWFKRIDVLRHIEDWPVYLSAILTVWACFTFKNFYNRMQFNTLLVNKFESRLAKLETQAKLLTLLASSTEPNREKKTKPVSLGGVDLGTPAPREDFSTMSKRKSAMEKLKELGFVSRLQEVMRERREGNDHLKEVFSGIVEASEAALQEDESVDDLHENSQQNFWTRLHAISKGYLVVGTLNGRLIIRRTKHAQSFSKKLYSFLSRMHRRRVSGRMLCDLIRNNARAEEEDTEAMVKELLVLFHVEDAVDSFITVDSMNFACKSVFEAYKYGASSLSDFGQVRKQVSAVVDVIFWIFMIIVVQMIVKLDIDAIFAPLLTLVFGVSFALGPTVAQACMAVAFVGFTLPYDVGDRIAIGVGSSKIVCNVVSISLLQTTVRTLFNERLQWPNHVLFSEKIMNLTKSTRAIIELPVAFALNGPDAPTKAQIKEFWRRIEQYCMVEEKSRWVFIEILGHTFNAKENVLGYSIWATMSYSFGQADEYFECRTLLVEKLRETQLAVGISFMDIIQPVDLYQGAHPDGRGVHEEKKPRSGSFMGSFDHTSSMMNILRSESRAGGTSSPTSGMKPRSGSDMSVGKEGSDSSPLSNRVPIGRRRSGSMSSVLAANDS